MSLNFFTRNGGFCMILPALGAWGPSCYLQVAAFAFSPGAPSDKFDIRAVLFYGQIYVCWVPWWIIMYRYIRTTRTYWWTIYIPSAQTKLNPQGRRVRRRAVKHQPTNVAGIFDSNGLGVGIMPCWLCLFLNWYSSTALKGWLGLVVIIMGSLSLSFRG